MIHQGQYHTNIIHQSQYHKIQKFVITQENTRTLLKKTNISFEIIDIVVYVCLDFTF